MYGLIGKNPKSLISALSSNIYLPSVGSYLDLEAPLVSSLTDLTVSDPAALDASRETPNSYNNFTVETGAEITDGALSVWIWCNIFRMSGGAILANATAGQDATIGCASQGGNGGSGGSGGGGGGGAYFCCSISTGGDGGSGGNGFDATVNCCGAVPGLGGSGFGNIYNAGNPFNLPFGGNGSGNSCLQPAQGGVGGRGFGGGGGGGSSTGLPNTFDGGGGGGGGLVNIACRDFSMSAGLISARGGNAGNGMGCCGYQGGFAGGGGVIAVFAMKYDGSLFGRIDVNGGDNVTCGSADAGSVVVYEVENDGITILAAHTNLQDTWNHL